MQRKTTTHAIERHHGRQRHGFGRFTRKSIIVSKSEEMVDLTMALLARFWVNGSQDELLSKWLRVLQMGLTSCRLGKNLILQCRSTSFT